MPDSRDVVWENIPKKLLPCAIPVDGEKLCAMVEEMFPRASCIEPIETMPYGNRKFTIAGTDENELGFVRERYTEGN